MILILLLFLLFEPKVIQFFLDKSCVLNAQIFLLTNVLFWKWNEAFVLVFLYWISRVLEILLFLLVITMYIPNLYWIPIIVMVISIISLFSIISELLRKAEGKLIEMINDNLFIYELSLLRANNQLLAINKSIEQNTLFTPVQNVEEYLDQLNDLYTITHWLVIKKIIILVDQNRRFSTKNLSMEFVSLSDDIHQRYFRIKKLELERKENLMLLPMMLNMILMMMYLISPFVSMFFGGT